MAYIEYVDQIGTPLLPTDKTRICPYNKAHEILVERWDGHLIKCRKQHPNSGIVICKFVWSHHIPKEEIAHHERECGKNQLNQGNKTPLNDPTFEIPDPSRMEKAGYVFDVDPEWEEEVPSYDPTAVAIERPVLRLMQNMTKRERREGRERERVRIRAILEAEKQEAENQEAEKQEEKEITEMVSSMESSMIIRKPNVENGAGGITQNQKDIGPRAIVLTKQRTATSTRRATTGESAFDKYLRDEMAQEESG